MEKCEFCGAQLPVDVSFCGNCGQVLHKTSHQVTGISNVSREQIDEADAQATIPNEGMLPEENETPSDESVPWESLSTVPLPVVNLAPLDEEQNEEDEEKRRRAALLGVGIPLLGTLADIPTGHMPSLTGTPQIAHMPSLTGTPQIAMPGQVGSGASTFPGSSSPTATPFSSGPGSPGNSGSPGPGPGGSGSPGASSGGPSGCLVAIIVVITTLVLILVSVVGLGLTVWAPNLTLNGSSMVAPGSTMVLQGSSFLPNSTIDLTLDSNTPIYYLQRSVPIQLAGTNIQRADSASLLLQLSAKGKNTLAVQGDGSFAISFLVDPAWTVGQHTLRASETLTRRSASLNFTITNTSATAVPSPSPTATATSGITPTPTATSGITPTATATSRPKPTATATPRPKPTATPTPPARLSVSPVRINGDTCSTVSVRGDYSCPVTLTNLSSLTSLTWSVTSISVSGVSVQASSHTIAANSRETVTLLVPQGDRSDTITITFGGPANSVAVTWYYQIIIT